MELFSPGHLIILAIVVAVLFFGWKQLPDMARSLGRSLRIFKTEIKGMSEDDKKRAEAGPQAQQAPPAVEGSTTAPTTAPTAAPTVPTVPPAVPSAPPASSSEPSEQPNGATDPSHPKTAQPVTKPFE
jgi:sec-independent protein translocase protein TatA